MKKRFFVVACVFTLFLGFVYSEEGQRNVLISKGIEYHNLLRKENSKEQEMTTNIEKCLSILEPFVSSDAVACAYYGSALTIKAGMISEKNPIKSLSYLEDGSKYLDKAVLMKSDDIELRIIRLENGIEVSRTSPVKRYGVILDDVNFLLEKNMNLLSADIQAEAYLYCGFYYQDSGDLETALELFERASEADSDCSAGKKALKMLEKYSE